MRQTQHHRQEVPRAGKAQEINLWQECQKFLYTYYFTQNLTYSIRALASRTKVTDNSALTVGWVITCPDRNVLIQIMSNFHLSFILIKQDVLDRSGLLRHTMTLEEPRPGSQRCTVFHRHQELHQGSSTLPKSIQC